MNIPITTVECSNEITITITITDKNYNYSNNYDIFIISDYISVYADHAIDKQNIVQAIEYLISVGPTCRYSMPSLLAGVGQLSQLAKLWLTASELVTKQCGPGAGKSTPVGRQSAATTSTLRHHALKLITPPRVKRASRGRGYVRSAAARAPLPQGNRSTVAVSSADIAQG